MTQEHVGSDWWTQVRKALGDIQDLKNFKNENVVRGIPLYGHLEDQFEKQVEQCKPIMGFRWTKALKANEGELGHTPESWLAAQRDIEIDGVKYKTTPWLIQALHHCLRFEHTTQHDLSKYERIIEFGAGIGELSRVIHLGGFKGSYEVYDFPETLRISQYYVPQIKPIADFSTIEMDDRKTLVIGTWSLSEAPIEHREAFVKKVKGADCLYAFQSNIWEYDNLDWFIWQFPVLSEVFTRYDLVIPDYNYSQGTNVYCFGKGRNGLNVYD